MARAKKKSIKAKKRPGKKMKAARKIKSKSKAKRSATKRKASKSAKKKVQAIPKGYNSVTPYLIVNDATHAIDFYKQAFGAKEVMRMEKNDGRIGHAELKIGDSKIMLADEYPDMGARSPRAFGGSPVTLHLYVANVDKIAQQAIAAGGKLIRPVENMFYGDRCGTVEDPYGHKWHISTHIEDVTPREMKKRMADFTSNQ